MRQVIWGGLVVLVACGGSKESKPSGGSGSDTATGAKVTADPQAKQVPPAGGSPIDAFGTALIAAWNSGDAAAAAQLVPTRDQLAAWWSCEGGGSLIDELGPELDEVRKGLAFQATDGPCKGGKCKLTSIGRREGDEPKLLAKGTEVEGCKALVDITAGPDLELQYAIDPDSSPRWELDVWTVDGRTYLKSFDH